MEYEKAAIREAVRARPEGERTDTGTTEWTEDRTGQESGSGS